jgi:hypothetical protein
MNAMLRTFLSNVIRAATRGSRSAVGESIQRGEPAEELRIARDKRLMEHRLREQGHSRRVANQIVSRHFAGTATNTGVMHHEFE